MNALQDPSFSASFPRTRPQPDWPIGVFDSGIGGLTVVRQIHRLMPNEDLVYLGDTARVPYGTKSAGTVIRFATEITEFLLQLKVKAIVAACNTVSAWALPALHRNFKLPILGVVRPGVATALEVSQSRRIGVIGTRATVRSDAYRRCILESAPRTTVFSRACPLLVPLVEEGWTRHPVTRQILKTYLEPLLKRNIDTLVLGCTHYPLLKPVLREITGKQVRLVDSAESCARDLLRELTEMQLLRPRNGASKGRITPFVTDEPERFGTMARRFLGRAPEAAKVELEAKGRWK